MTNYSNQNQTNNDNDLCRMGSLIIPYLVLVGAVSLSLISSCNNHYNPELNRPNTENRQVLKGSELDKITTPNKIIVEKEDK